MEKKYLITISSRWQQYFIFRTVLSISREQFSLIGNFPSDLPNYTTLPTPTYPPHLSLVNAVKRPEILQQEKTFDIFPKMFFSPVYIGQKDLVSARGQSFDPSFGCQTPEPPPDTRPRLACNCQGPFLSSPDMSDLL